MKRAYAAVAGVTILANGAAVIADMVPAGFVLKNCDEVRVSRSWLPLLAAWKAAGAAGLALGLLGKRKIGTVAAAGLALFFIGAITTHVRARAFHNIAFPGLYLALAAASVALSLENQRQ